MKNHLLVKLGGLELRLHVWPRGAEGPDDGPHAHSSWLVALPLWGTLIEKRFAPNDWPRDAGELARGRFRFLGARFWHPGRSYFCSSRTIHSLMPIDSGAAASIMLSKGEA